MRVKKEGRYFLLIKLLILIALLSILLFGCNSQNTNQSVRLKNGLIYHNGQEHPYTGRVLDTLNQTIIAYDVVNGMKNGEFCLSSLSGTPFIKGYIKNNKNEGKWIYLYKNGKIESEGGFKNDLPHGKWRWYYADGVLKSEGYYISGKQVGAWQKFDDTGKLIKEVYYQFGKKVREIVFKKLKSV